MPAKNRIHLPTGFALLLSVCLGALPATAVEKPEEGRARIVARDYPDPHAAV